jgi:hypothetical protein
LHYGQGAASSQQPYLDRHPANAIPREVDSFGLTRTYFRAFLSARRLPHCTPKKGTTSDFTIEPRETHESVPDDVQVVMVLRVHATNHEPVKRIA